MLAKVAKTSGPNSSISEQQILWEEVCPLITPQTSSLIGLLQC